MSDLHPPGLLDDLSFDTVKERMHGMGINDVSDDSLRDVMCATRKLARPYAESLAALPILVEATRELLEVAELRGDNALPHPANDYKLWTARMQDAWDDLDLLLSSIDTTNPPVLNEKRP